MNKFTVLALAVSGLFSATVAQASDGQIQLNGQIFSQTCTVAIDGSPTGNSTITLDGIPVSDLTVPLETMSGSAMQGSDVIKNVQITLEGCTLPSGKTTVGVSFDSTGYGQNAYSSYRNMLLDSINTNSTAAKGVNIGFTAPSAASELLMGAPKAEYKAPVTGGSLSYDYQVRYVMTAATTAEVVAGDLDSVATFSLVYQ